MEHWKGKCETTPAINSTTKIQNRNAPVRRPPSETASKPDQTSHRPLSTEQLLTPTQHHRRPILRVWTRRREREALLATMQKVRRTKEGVEEEGGGKEHENGEQRWAPGAYNPRALGVSLGISGHRTDLVQEISEPDRDRAHTERELINAGLRTDRRK